MLADVTYRTYRHLAIETMELDLFISVLQTVADTGMSPHLWTRLNAERQNLMCSCGCLLLVMAAAPVAQFLLTVDAARLCHLDGLSVLFIVAANVTQHLKY